MSAATHFDTVLRLAPRGFEARVSRHIPQPVALESRQLLQGQSEVLIHHGGEVYRLRHTRNDKLILTK